MVTTNSVADARSGMNFGKQTRQAFTVEWENVKGITLESKYIDIKFKKAVATKVIEMDLQTGKEMKFEKQEKEVQIYFKKTSQAREATKLFNELRSALAK
jgi:thiol:disulfide interchange protein